MTVSVNAVNNDAAGRNIDILGKALDLATGFYKVRLDDDARKAALALSEGQKKEELNADQQKQAVAFAKDFEIVDPTTKGAIDPSSMGIKLPMGINLPQGMAIRPRSIAENEAKLVAAQQEKQADRDNRLQMAQLTAATRAENKQPTEGERLTALYGKRLEQADSQLAGLEDKATGMGSYLESWLPSGLQSKERQLLEQSQRNFITAALRKESGASISPQEFATAREQYFAQPGDTPEVVAQKKANRELVIQGFQVAAGKAYGNLDNVINQTAAVKEKVEVPGVGVVSREQILEELRRRQGKTGTASNQ